jgi:hypothetical protein
MMEIKSHAPDQERTAQIQARVNRYLLIQIVGSRSGGSDLLRLDLISSARFASHGSEPLPDRSNSYPCSVRPSRSNSRGRGTRAVLPRHRHGELRHAWRRSWLGCARTYGRARVGTSRSRRGRQEGAAHQGRNSPDARRTTGPAASSVDLPLRGPEKKMAVTGRFLVVG